MGNTALEWLTATGLSQLTQKQNYLEALQFVEPTWQHTRTWSNGGCFVLAEAIHLFLSAHEVACQFTTIYGTWDEDPLHTVVKVGEQIIDHEGLQDAERALKEWKDYLRGGAIFNPLDAAILQEYGFPVDHELSKTMASFLEAAFQNEGGADEEEKATRCGVRSPDTSAKTRFDTTARSCARRSLRSADEAGSGSC